VLAFLCTLALVLYVDRVCVGQAEMSMRKDLGLTMPQIAWMNNAFTLAYILFEVPVGHWGDRYGSRGVIARIVVAWSTFTALTGAAWNFSSLLVIRFLFGAGEAGAFPNASRVVTRWFPPRDRGKARGAITTTSLLGGAMTPPVAAYLIGLVGWRWTFVIFGALGIVWAAAFYYWFRDDPAEHPEVNDAERELIGKHPESTLAAGHSSIPWKIVLRSPNVWLMGGIITVGASLFYVLFQWYATYLKQGRGVPEQTSGWLTGLVMLGGAAGCLSGGWLADWVVRRTGERRWSRRVVGSGSFVMAALSVLFIPGCRSPLAASCFAAAALFFVQLMIPGWWSVVAEISGAHGASMFGLMNSLGGVGAMAAPQATAQCVAYFERQGVAAADCWVPVFYGGAVVLALGAVCWMCVDATRSVVEPQAE